MTQAVKARATTATAATPRIATLRHRPLRAPSWPGLSRPSTFFVVTARVVDARVKPGHDDGVCGEVSLIQRSFRRTHLDRTCAGAAVARGIVHVLDIGLRQHVFARRYRAHDIGDGEHRLVVGGTVDGGGEA